MEYLTLAGDELSGRTSEKVKSERSFESIDLWQVIMPRQWIGSSLKFLNYQMSLEEMVAEDAKSVG